MIWTNIALVLLGISLIGFIIGLAGKNIALNKNSMRKNRFYQRLLMVFLVFMFIFAIAYKLLT